MGNTPNVWRAQTPGDPMPCPRIRGQCPPHRPSRGGRFEGGWIAEMEIPFKTLPFDANIETLQQRLGAPPLMVMPYKPSTAQRAAAARAALSRLLEKMP